MTDKKKKRPAEKKKPVSKKFPNPIMPVLTQRPRPSDKRGK